MAEKSQHHAPKKIRSLSHIFCTKCGLVYLNNRVSRFAVKHGCNYDEHPAYKSELIASVAEKTNG